MRRLLEALGIAAGAVTAFWWLVPVTGRGRAPSAGLTFALIRPTVPAWTAAACC